MEKTYDKLNFVRETSDSVLCQTEDGTIFYFHDDAKGKYIYVMHGNQKIRANLPRGCLRAHGVHGRMMYFEVDKKIYKAAFTPPQEIEINLVRDRIESFHRGGFCKRLLNGVNYVYHMWDDPEKDAIKIDIVDARLENAVLTDIYRGKVLYVHHSYKSSTFHRLSVQISLLEADYQSGKFFRGSSRFVYTASADSEIAVLSTDTMELCATLRFKNFRIFDIVGVCDGRITVYGQEEGCGSLWNKKVMSAVLPKVLTVCEIDDDSAKIPDENTLLKQQIADLKKENVESSAKTAELEEQNRELTAQLETITRKYQELLMIVP